MNLSLPLLTATMVLILAHGAAAQDTEKRAPYSDIRWSNPIGESPEEESPEVLIGNAWYRLRSIDTFSVAEITAFARAEYGIRWQKRFDEDLVEVFGELGHEPGPTVSLGLYDATDDREFTMGNVPMTSDNRRAIMRAKYARLKEAERPSYLSPEEAREDLGIFQTLLEERFAYLHANDVDYRAAIDEVSRIVDTTISNGAFGLALRSIVARFIDGHADVSGYPLPPGYLPFLIESTGDRFVAFAPDRSEFLDDEHPFIVGLDGRPIEQWIEAARPFIQAGSPQYIRRQSLRLLRHIEFLRSRLGLPTADIIIQLVSHNGADTTETTLPLSATIPQYGDWPIRGSQLLNDSIGYLRLPDMNDAAVQDIRHWMPKFRETAGLIIDVRGNGGGSRDALLEIFPYFTRPQDTPRVLSVAAYRLQEGIDSNYLDSRYMYRESSERWTDAERSAIRRFHQTFKPEWRPPTDKFSDWHFLVASGAEGRHYSYDRPVVVLMDSRAFSATDIFLAALKGMPNVTLVGEPSGGGSARSRSFTLKNSRLSVRLASMASFQPNGLLYDTRGVTPDVPVVPDPTFVLREGNDAALARAVEILTR